MNFSKYVIQGAIERLAREYNLSVEEWNKTHAEPEEQQAYMAVVMTFEKPKEAFTDIP